jgi:hypothetical protein
VFSDVYLSGRQVIRRIRLQRLRSMFLGRFCCKKQCKTFEEAVELAAES